MRSFYLFIIFLNFSRIVYTQPVIKVQIGHSDAVTSIAFTHDGKYILSGSKDRTVKLWDFQTGKEVLAFTGCKNEIKSISYSSDGNYIVGSNQGAILMWDIKTGKTIQKIIGNYVNSIPVALTQDGRIALIGHSQILEFWNMSSGKMVFSSKGHSAPIRVVKISHDSKFALTGTEEGEVKLWNVETGKETLKFDGHKGTIVSVAFSPNGEYALSGSKTRVKGISKLIYDSSIKLWNIKTGQEIKCFNENSNDVISVAFSPDGKSIFASLDKGLKDKSGLIKRWDINIGSEIQSINSSSIIKSIDISPNGKYLVAGLGDNSIKIWDLSIKTEIADIKGISKSASAIAVSPDGKKVLLGSDDNTFKLVDISTGKIEKTFTASFEHLNSVAFSPDGKHFISCSNDEIFRIWNVLSGKIEKQGYSPLNNKSTYSPDGKYLIIGSYLKEVGSLQDIKKLGDYGDKNFIFSPTSKLCLSINHEDMNLWDVSSGVKIKTLKGHIGPITSTAFSSDGKYIISGAGTFAPFLSMPPVDNSIKLWDVSKSQEIRTFKGHLDEVTCVAFSPNGKYILSGSLDQTLILWDVLTGNAIKCFKEHGGSVNSVSFSIDGNFAISVANDGIMRVWSIEKGELMYSWTANSQGDFLSWTPNGYFEGSQALAKTAVYIQDGMNVFPIDQLFENYFSPGIIESGMNGLPYNQQTDYNIVNIKPPTTVKILSPETNTTTTNPTATILVDVTDQGGGIDEIRLYHNGKLIDGTQRGFKPVSSSGAKETKSFTIQLVNGENRIQATAFNTQRTESTPDEILITYNGTKATSNMYILAVGINTYSNPRYSLNYAVDDASGFVDALKIGASTIFASVNTTIVNNEQATRQGILDAVEGIKAKIKPEDVFVFYYAGHGVMSTGSPTDKSDFYLVPTDITKMYEADDMLKAKGISAKEIAEFSKNIKAQKQLFVLDACQSGGAMLSLASRGAAEEKSIAQLARSTGTYFITASGTEQFATEVKELGHGVFTYSIIEALKGICKTQDGKVTVNLLKSCIEDRVPELTKKYKGEAQYPTGYGFGQDFPIVIVK